MKEKLITIARYLMTEYREKEIGYCKIYQDNRIAIHYDTYRPCNVNVYVLIDNKWQHVLYLHHNECENAQKYRPGTWEKYVTDILYPKAVEAQKAAGVKTQQEEDADFNKRFDPIDDKEIFAKALRRN